MSDIFNSIYSLFVQLFTGAPEFVTGEICQWLSVACCLFLVSIPFIFVVKLIRLLIGR